RAMTAGIGQFGAIQALAPSVGVEVRPVNVRDAGEIELAFAAFAGSANVGLIVTASPLAAIHRDPSITLAARHWTQRAAGPSRARRRGDQVTPLRLAPVAQPVLLWAPDPTLPKSLKKQPSVVMPVSRSPHPMEESCPPQPLLYPPSAIRSCSARPSLSSGAAAASGWRPPDEPAPRALVSSSPGAIPSASSKQRSSSTRSVRRPLTPTIRPPCSRSSRISQVRSTT